MMTRNLEINEILTGNGTARDETRARNKRNSSAGCGISTRRDFFEAHEVWEEIWLVEDEPEKTFLQGNYSDCRSISSLPARKFRRRRNAAGSGNCENHAIPRRYRGLAIHDLREEAKFWARALGEMQRPGDARLPAIRRLDNSAMVSDSPPAQVHSDKSKRLPTVGRPASLRTRSPPALARRAATTASWPAATPRRRSRTNIFSTNVLLEFRVAHHFRRLLSSRRIAAACGRNCARRPPNSPAPASPWRPARSCSADAG